MEGTLEFRKWKFGAHLEICMCAERRRERERERESEASSVNMIKYDYGEEEQI